MPKYELRYVCPNCDFLLDFEMMVQQIPDEFINYCPSCYFPHHYNVKEKKAKVRIQNLHKRAFLIHSSKREDKYTIDWLKLLLKQFGISSALIEQDVRVKVDWLQKSVDAIKNSDFVIAFLTKRYQYTNESREIVGWKAPDKCYDEVAMSFAMQKDLFGLIEKGVDSGRVLEARAWCYQFEMIPSKNGLFQLKADLDFFKRLDVYVNRFDTI